MRLVAREGQYARIETVLDQVAGDSHEAAVKAVMTLIGREVSRFAEESATDLGLEASIAAITAETDWSPQAHLRKLAREYVTELQRDQQHAGKSAKRAP